MRRSGRLQFVFVIIIVLWHPRFSSGDTFIVREDDGHTVMVEARLAGEGKGAVALERADGRLEVVPHEQILKREPGSDPEPISTAEMIRRLTEEFGAEKFRAYADAPYVIGLVLSEPLPKNFESKASTCLKKGVSFMKTVEKVFLDFVNDLKIDIEKPKFPLVLLIFETDDDFIRFTSEQMGGRGPSAGAILGYYSELSNRLAIRMSECHTFETPLHEAIHQQVFNRGLLQRLSSSPAWFNEGIATGFEGNGDKINGGPLRVSSLYARAASRAKNVDWDDVVAEDKAFRGDVLAGEAYAHAWSIHWFLVTRYRKQYIDYLKRLRQKPTLQVDDAATRVNDFEQVFGKRVGQLQSEFPQALEQSARRQKISLNEVSPRRMISQMNLAEVEMNAIENQKKGDLTVEGRIRNLSQIRPMSFYIMIETEAGAHAEWFLPNVASQKIVSLPRKIAVTPREQKRGVRPGNERQEGTPLTIRIQVKTAVPDSETGQKWQRGDFPIPPTP